jgi:integrase/recombinase XerC
VGVKFSGGKYMDNKITLSSSIESFFENQQEIYSSNTQRAYKRGLELFLESLAHDGINSEAKVSEISTKWFDDFVTFIKSLSPSTQHVHLQAVITWSKFLSDKYSINIKINDANLFRRLPKIRKTAKTNRSEFHAISRIITYANSISNKTYNCNKEYLQALRDKAIILILADTGLDVSTIPNILKNDLDWDDKRLSISIRNRIDTVTLSPRVFDAIIDYLNERQPTDSNATRTAKSLPLFSRHDKGSGKKILKITATTIRNVVKQRSHEALGRGTKQEIIPISFRHYFISTITQSFSSFHPKIAGKCRVYFDTGLYDDAIFNAMKIVEDEVRKKASLPNTDYGVNLISNAMSPKAPIIIFSTISAEQEAAHNLFRGALGSSKNPLSHRFLDTDDPVKTFEILSLASLLMRMLDEVH